MEEDDDEEGDDDASGEDGDESRGTRSQAPDLRDDASVITTATAPALSSGFLGRDRLVGGRANEGMDQSYLPQYSDTESESDHSPPGSVRGGRGRGSGGEGRGGQDRHRDGVMNRGGGSAGGGRKKGVSGRSTSAGRSRGKGTSWRRGTYFGARPANANAGPISGTPPGTRGMSGIEAPHDEPRRTDRSVSAGRSRGGGSNVVS